MNTSTGKDPVTTSHAFWQFWAATSVSRFGSTLTIVAMPFIAIYLLEASTLDIGLLAAASGLSWLLVGLPAGAIVQRLPMKTTLITADVVRAALLASIVICGLTDTLTMAHLFLVAVLSGCGDVVFDVGAASYLPSIVSHDQLNHRNSLISGADSVASFGGAPLGGWIAATLGGLVAVTIDLLSFIFSAAALARLPERRAEVREQTGSMRATIASGWRTVTRHPIIRPYVMVAALINAVGGAHAALFVVFLLRDAGVPPALLGVFLAIDGLGALAAASVTPLLVHRLGTARVAFIGSVAAAVGALLVPFAGGWLGNAAFCLGTSMFAAGCTTVSITTRSHRQNVVPLPDLAPVMATVRFISWGAIPVGSAAAGFIGQAAGARTAMWIAALVALLTIIVILCSPARGLRDLERYSTSGSSPDRSSPLPSDA